MKKHLKIVHCGIFNEKDNGNFFYGLERKISHGFIQNGHFVYDFSYRDIERNNRTFGVKDSGLKKMNLSLIEICKNIDADILVLAKAEKIFRSTIETIKKTLPNIKVIQWYVDHLEEKKDFFEKLDCMDAFFYANAKELKNLSLKYTDTIFSFFPNISDPAFDKSLNYEKTTDVLYIARDYKEDVRTKFALLLKEFCEKENIKLNVFASLGKPAIFGNDFHKEIAKSKIAINFNRDDHLNEVNQEKVLGASDRMAQFLGSKVCTFSPRIKGFEKLYEDEKDLVYFDCPKDCFEKIKKFLQNKKYLEIAQNGQNKTFDIANAKRVTNFMLEVLFNRSKANSYEWAEYKYKKGKEL
ncbi:glycosyltransferase [Arcobacter sp. YIC-80]|uniref:glycosyltransferase family protein n=1 Tax=Arcobacter sp. YIC-80 TaxID=3376683 RepID=UPI00384D58A7